MKSIQSLIQQINKEGDKDRKREYDAFKQLDDNIIELQNRIANLEKKNLRYYCRAYNSGNVSIPNAVSTPIALNLTHYPQLGNMHDNTIANTNIYIRRSGVYYIFGGIQWATTAGGTFRQIALALVRGGATIFLASDRAAPMGAAINAQSTASAIYCYENDIIQLQAIHDQGGPVNIIANDIASPSLIVAERMEDLDPSEYGLLDPNANTR